jgi:hypothetical protein
MNKFLVTFALIIAIVLLAGGIYASWYYQHDKYETKTGELTASIDTAQEELEKVKEAQDEKGYSPSDVAKYFVNEYKNDSMDRAKLYLAQNKQVMDIKSAFGFSDKLDQVNVTDYTYTISGDSAEVKASGFYVVETDTFQKTFFLVKENGLWKINQIV